MSTSKYLWPIVALLSLSVAIGFSTFCDDDTFWHIALGRLTSEGPLPTASPFTFYNTKGTLWQDQSWFFDSLLYQLWKIGGWNSLHSLRIVLLFLLGFSVFKRYGNKALSLSLLLLLATHFFSALRPHMVGMLCFSICLGELNKKANRKSFVILLFILLLWHSSHASWPLFFVGLAKRFFEKESRNTELFGFTLAYIILLFITPLNPIETFEMVFRVGSGYEGSTFTTEWLPFFDSRGKAYLEFSFLASCMVLGFWSLCCFKLKYRPHWYDALFILGLIALGLKSRRFMPFCVLAMTHNLMPFINSQYFKWEKQFKAGTLLASALVIGLLVSDTWYRYKNQVPRFASGVCKEIFPIEAVAHIKKNKKANKKIFNDFDSGGYLVLESFPEYQPFITGTSVNRELETIYRKIVDGVVDASKAIDQLGCDHILMGLSYSKYHQLIQQLKRSPIYSLSFIDEKSCVFTRNSVSQKEDIETTTKTLASWPNSNTTAMSLGAQASFLDAWGEKDRALAIYNKAISLYPQQASLYYNRGLLYGQMNDGGNACEDFEKALQFGGKDPELLMHYGNALTFIKEEEKALVFFREAYDSGLRHPVLIRNFKLLLQRFGYETELQEILEDERLR